MEKNTAEKTAKFEDLSTFIENLKFKKTVVGGIDQENAYQALRTMYSMFVDIYVAEQEKNTQLQAKYDKLSQSISEAEIKATEINKRAISSAEKYKAEAETLRQQLSAAEEQKAELSRKLSALGTEKSELAQKLSEKENEHKSLSDEASRLKRESDNVSASDLEKATSALLKERDELRQQLKEANEALENENFKRESLEEIYLDANKRRRDIIKQANQTAEELVSNAQSKSTVLLETAEKEVSVLNAEKEKKSRELETMTAELEQFRRDAEHAAEYLKAEALRKAAEECYNTRLQAEAELEKLRAETDQACKEQRAQTDREIARSMLEAQQRKDEMLADAKKAADSMQTEGEVALATARQTAQSLITEAQARCDQEEKKLADIRSSVSALRETTINSLNHDIASLQSFAAALLQASET